MRLLYSQNVQTGFVVVGGSGQNTILSFDTDILGNGIRADAATLVLKATASTITVGQCALRLRGVPNADQGTGFTVIAQDLQSGGTISSASPINLGTAANSYGALLWGIGGMGPFAQGLPFERIEATIDGTGVTGNQTWDAWLMLWTR